MPLSGYGTGGYGVLGYGGYPGTIAVKEVNVLPRIRVGAAIKKSRIDLIEVDSTSRVLTQMASGFARVVTITVIRLP